MYASQGYIRQYKYFRYSFSKDRHLKIPQGIMREKFFDVLRDSEILTGWNNLLSIQSFCTFDLWSFDVACIRLLKGSHYILSIKVVLFYYLNSNSQSIPIFKSYPYVKQIESYFYTDKIKDHPSPQK